MSEENQAKSDSGSTGAPPKPTDLSSLAESLLAPESPMEDSSQVEEQQGDDEVAAIQADKAQSPDNPDAETEQPDGKEEEKDEEAEDEESDEDQEEDADEDEEPSEADEDGEDEEADDEDAEPVFTTPDGDEVTLDELKAGYLRQADYTRKTQQVAEMRKQGEQALAQFEQHNNVVAEHLSMALDVLEPQLTALSQTNWEQLASEDAYEYAEKRAQYDFAQQRYAQLRQAAQQRVSEHQQLRDRKMAEYRAKEAQALQMAIPDLADPKVGPKYAQAIREYAESSVGLSPEEAGNIMDHRMIMVLDKARKFDELQNSTLSASRKKLSKSPKRVAKAGKPSSKSEQQAARQKNARAKLSKERSTDSFVDFLLS